MLLSSTVNRSLGSTIGKKIKLLNPVILDYAEILAYARR